MGHSDKVTFETETCRKWESELQRYLGEEHAGSRKSKCKGPGARVCLVDSRNNKEVSVLGVEQSRGEEQERPPMRKHIHL